MATRKSARGLPSRGESAYKQAIRDCNNEIKTMRSELTLVQSRYQTNANSVEALKAKYLAFGQALEAQKNKGRNAEAGTGERPERPAEPRFRDGGISRKTDRRTAGA